MTIQLYVATRKGVWIATASEERRTWSLASPIFLGQQCHHVMLDPRDRKTLLLASRQWHLGPTVFRSTDGGASWKEATTPPQFPKGEARGRAVDHVFHLTPGHSSEPGVWYAGTSPQGLFRSEDGGVTWAPVSGFNDHPEQVLWVGSDKDQTPDGGKLHSILVDPTDARHLYVSMSGGGTFESSDRGATWKPFNKGLAVHEMFPPKPDGSEYEYGHDPHCTAYSPSSPSRLWQQSHCGLYRIDRPAERWTRVGDNMPKEIGDVGFPVVPHPRDADTAWVFPMNGTGDWPRTPVEGAPAVYKTRDAGATWERKTAGFPAEQAWWTVKRQAMCADSAAEVGVYFGTTQGEVWGSVDEGESFGLLFRNLPQINAVTLGEPVGA
jgi:hypothetical protein